MSNQLLTEKLKSYVESMIAAGQYAPGDRLPPLRNLAEQFELTTGTARRAIKELCDRGILSFRHGSGTYVNTRVNHSGSSKTISVALWNEEITISYCAYAANGLIAAANHTDYLLRFYYVSYPEPPDRPLELPAEMWDACAVIFLGTYDKFKIAGFKGSKPCVGVEMHDGRDGVLSTVSIDPFAAAELAAGHFRRLGIKNVIVASADTPVHLTRAEVFRNVWEKTGRCEVVRQLESIEAPAADTGLLFASGSQLNSFAVALKEKTGQRVADYPNILSIDGKSLIIPHYEPVRTIHIDWKAAGATAFAECVRRIEQPGSEARRIYISPGLFLL